MKGALAAFFVATLAVAANAQMAPPAEQLQAQPDSPFIQRLLVQPFRDDHDTTVVAVQTLRTSGNEAQARLLERAEQQAPAGADGRRAARAARHVQGRDHARDPDSPPLDDGMRGALGRVELTYASERDPDAAPAGADETRVADGVWTRPFMHLTQVHALFRIHNGLPVPLRRVGMRIVPTQGMDLSVSCEPENPRDIAPGSTRVVLCRGRIAANASAIRCVPWWIARLAHLLGQAGPGRRRWRRRGDPHHRWRRPPRFSFEDGRKNGKSEAFAALAGAACQDKGTCPAIAQAQQQRAEVEHKKTAPSRNFGIGALVAVLLAAVAAAAVKPRRSPGFAMPIVAVLVIVFAAFAVATGYYTLQPGASVA